MVNKKLYVFILTLLLYVLIIFYSKHISAAPVAANLAVVQRTDGSGLVDIRYDLSNGEDPITVEMEASNDGGATWNKSPRTQYLSGDIGTVTNGTNKHIIWDFAHDIPGVCWPEMKIRLIVTDESVDPEITLLLPGDVPLELVWIPAGTFMMGRKSGEQDSFNTEDPQHRVTLSQGFYMGKYLVTQQQWLAVTGSWPGTTPDLFYGAGDNYPAYYVSWNDTQNFIAALNTHIRNTSQSPATLRLPSEAEWEYACRAGTTTRFYWGDDPTYAQIGNYAWYYGDNSSSYGVKPVGGKTPNVLKLYDMSGNVWEWCEDDYHSSYTGAPINGIAWVDSPRGSERVVRGGCWGRWYFGAWDCRSAARYKHTHDYRFATVGFRLAK